MDKDLADELLDALRYFEYYPEVHKNGWPDKGSYQPARMWKVQAIEMVKAYAIAKYGLGAKTGATV